MYVIKTDSLGNFMWSKLYGGTGNDAGAGIALTPDGGYILSGLGMFNSNQQWMDGAIRRIDAEGNLIWEKLIGNKNNNGFEAKVYMLSDNNYITLGSYRDTINPSAVNAWLVKFDINGNIHWQRFYNKHGGNNHNYFRDLKETPDKGFVIIGELTNFSPFFQVNMWLIKLDSMGCDVSDCALSIPEIPNPAPTFTLYPNPAQDVLHIETSLNTPQTTLHLYDITGKEILHTPLNNYSQTLNISSLPAGMYICLLRHPSTTLHQKLVIQR